IPVRIRATGNLPQCLCESLRIFDAKNRFVYDGLDQDGAEYGSLHTKDQVVVGCCRLEVRLGDVASRRIRSPGDGEQVMDAAVTSAVWIKLESRFTDRPVDRDEIWNDVGGAFFVGDINLWILKRAGSTDIGLGVAACTTVQVEPRS